MRRGRSVSLTRRAAPQNSYGTSMTTAPFLGDVALHGMRESQNWWFDNMADGSTNNY